MWRRGQAGLSGILSVVTLVLTFQRGRQKISHRESSTISRRRERHLRCSITRETLTGHLFWGWRSEISVTDSIFDILHPIPDYFCRTLMERCLIPIEIFFPCPPPRALQEITARKGESRGQPVSSPTKSSRHRFLPGSISWKGLEASE